MTTWHRHTETLFTVHKDGSSYWRDSSKKLIRMDSSPGHPSVAIYSFSQGYFVTVGDEVTLEIAMNFRTAEKWFERLKKESEQSLHHQLGRRPDTSLT